jgi:hypothetical protein
MNLQFQNTNIKKTACFIHSTNLNINKTEILEHLINYLSNCDFFSNIDFVFINNIGEPINNNFFHNISTKIIINNFSNDTNLFEICTLKLLHFFSILNPDYKILYLHTKGVSYAKYEYFFSRIMDWTNLMLYGLVYQSKSCIELLDNYDCVGLNYMYKNEKTPCHFSGNFWWANANYIKYLNLHSLKIKHDAEWWIFTKNPRFLNLHSNIIDHYLQSYKLSQYEDIIIKNLNYYKNNKDIHRNNIIHLIIDNKDNIVKEDLSIITDCLFNIINNNLYNKIKQLVIVDSFNIDEIIDINHINNYLKDYNIILIPKNKVRLDILKVEYGIMGINTYDITDKIKELCLKSDKYFFMPKNEINFNGINGDPVPGYIKEVFIYYKINDINYFTSILEKDSYEPIIIDLINRMNINSYSTNYVLESTKDNPLYKMISQLFS